MNNDSNSQLLLPTVIPGNVTFQTDNDSGGSIGTIIAIIILLVFGLVAHILAILATRKAGQLWKEDLHNYVPYFLVNVLLKIDFFAVVFYLVRGLATPLLTSYLIFRCEFSYSTNILFTWMSGFANVTMCLERCFALIAPFHYRKYVTIFKVKVILVPLMVVAILMSFMPIFGFSSYRREVMNGEYECLSPGDPHVTGVNFVLEYTVIFFFVGFSTVFIICVSNLVVVCFIMRLKHKITPSCQPRQSPGQGHNSAPNLDPNSHTSTRREHTGPVFNDSRSKISTNWEIQSARKPVIGQTSFEETNGSDQVRKKDGRKQNRKEIKLAIMFVLVSMVYTISWLPIYVNRFLVALQVPTFDFGLRLAVCLMTVNHVIDPVIFVFLKQKNRQALMLVLLQCYPDGAKKRQYNNTTGQTIAAAVQYQESTGATGSATMVTVA